MSCETCGFEHPGLVHEGEVHEQVADALTENDNMAEAVTASTTSGEERHAAELAAQVEQTETRTAADVQIATVQAEAAVDIAEVQATAQAEAAAALADAAPDEPEEEDPEPDDEPEEEEDTTGGVVDVSVPEQDADEDRPTPKRGPRTVPAFRARRMRSRSRG